MRFAGTEFSKEAADNREQCGRLVADRTAVLRSERLRHVAEH
jgi:hypothetical protein